VHVISPEFLKESWDKLNDSGNSDLEIAEEKSRRIVFGRFATERMAKTGSKPEEFNFLGFRHNCGKDRAGKFTLIRLPVQESISGFLEGTKKWLRNTCSGR
jgi:RNA-directed DNA polymerase